MGFGYLEIVNGIFSIIIVCIFTLVGLKIAKIYSKSKEKVYILVGLTWVLLASPWYSSSTSFIVALFNYGQGLIPIPLLYFILAIPLIPITTILFITGFTEIMFRDYKWMIRILFVIIGILMEIFFILFMIINPTEVLTLTTPVNARYSRLILIYILFSLGVFLVVGFFLARSSIQLGTPENKVKGYFLFTALILFIVGSIFDAVIEFTDLLLLLPRFVLLSSALCYYLGFVTPNVIKKRLIKV